MLVVKTAAGASLDNYTNIFTSGGLFRTDDFSGTNQTSPILVGEVDSITSDGTYLFGNEYSLAQGKIHKWLPEGDGTTFSLTDQQGISPWTTPELGAGRIRGVSYDKNCLYVSPGGSGSNRNIYAIDSTTGEVYDMGGAAESSGGVYGVIVVNP